MKKTNMQSFTSFCACDHFAWQLVVAWWERLAEITMWKKKAFVS
jgi:hypothetical protein